MNEYVRQAKNFLESCNATMTITYLGKGVNAAWNENFYRNTYRATIKTPYGTMWVKFWDSLANMSNNKQPTKYDILACLQKYDVGSFEDFISEFGYEIYEPADRCRVKRIYEAVVHEYESVRRCFTEEQIEQMREIQ